MQIDRIKISQEINFNGMPTWIGIEASLLPDEDEKEGLRTIQKSITDYQTQEQQAYSKSKWATKDADKKADPVTGMIAAITTCTSLTTLKTFEKLAKSNPDFQEAYTNRLNQLTDKQ